MDVQRSPRDTSRNNDAYMYGNLAPCPTPLTYDGHALGPLSSNAVVENTNHEISHGGPSNAGNKSSGVRTDETVVRRFLEEAGDMGSNKTEMPIVGMRSLVSGSLNC